MPNCVVAIMKSLAAILGLLALILITNGTDDADLEAVHDEDVNLIDNVETVLGQSLDNEEESSFASNFRRRNR